MEALGVNLKFLIIQIVNIAIFYFLFTKFLLRPIIKILDERKRKIQQGVEDAQKAKDELKQAEEIKEESHKKARAEERKIVDEARVEARKKADTIIDDARMKAAKIVADANVSAQHIEKEVLRRSQDDELRLVEVIVEKILGEKLNHVELKAKYQKLMSEIAS